MRQRGLSDTLSAVLFTLRQPVVDLRPFASAAAVRRSIRTPPSWSPGEFMRYIGGVVPRHLGSLEEWPSERNFVDFSSAAVIDPAAWNRLTAEIGNRYPRVFLRSNNRRITTQLPNADALLNADISFTLSDTPKGLYTSELVPFLSQVARRCASSELYHLRSTRPGSRAASYEYDWLLDTPSVSRLVPTLYRNASDATHWPYRSMDPFGVQDVFDSAQSLVRAGAPVAMLEIYASPGWTSSDRQRYEIADHGITVVEDRSILGNQTPTFIIVGHNASRAVRRSVRTVRLALLALWSATTFLNEVVKVAKWTELRLHPKVVELATARSPEFDSLQRAIAHVLHLLGRPSWARPEGSADLLTAVSSAHVNLPSTQNFQYLRERLLSNARPALLKRLRQLEDADRERVLMAQVLQRTVEPVTSPPLVIQIGSKTMTKKTRKYRADQIGIIGGKGNQVGSVGKKSEAGDVTRGQVQSQQLTIGSTSVDVFDLVTQLQQLRTLLEGTGNPDARADIAALAQAEAAARQQDGGGVRRALSTVGRWVLRVGESIAVPAAISAIEAATSGS